MLTQFLEFFSIGLFAQFIDGSIGMAYGVISTTTLLGLGVSPVVASMSVHLAESFTTAISGLSHAIFKNVDYKLFLKIIIPGVIGSIIGAYMLTQLPLDYAKPLVIAYLFLMGLVILYKALFKMRSKQEIKKIFIQEQDLDHKMPSTHVRGSIPLGFIGGFCDASGGGGWGPIVTSSLLAQGATPHYTVGTISLAEFLVALSASITFVSIIGFPNMQIVGGLIVGGAVGAPLAAFSVRRINSHVLMIAAGLLITTLCVVNLIKYLHS